jgi:hypothetical protein
MEEGGSTKEIIKPDFRSGEFGNAMSIVIDPSHRPSSLRYAADWFREAKAALTHPTTEVSGMSARELRDIGMKPRSLTSTVYREIGKPSLVDFGWRLGR